MTPITTLELIAGFNISGTIKAVIAGVSYGGLIAAEFSYRTRHSGSGRACSPISRSASGGWFSVTIELQQYRHADSCLIGMSEFRAP